MLVNIEIDRHVAPVARRMLFVTSDNSLLFEYANRSGWGPFCCLCFGRLEIEVDVNSRRLMGAGGYGPLAFATCEVIAIPQVVAPGALRILGTSGFLSGAGYTVAGGHFERVSYDPQKQAFRFGESIERGNAIEFASDCIAIVDEDRITSFIIRVQIE